MALLLLASCSGKEPGSPVSRIPGKKGNASHPEEAAPQPSGEKPTVAAVPGNAGREPRTNAPPEIRSVKFVPEIFRPGDALGVEVSGSDPDGDDVTFEYAWEKNGTPAGEGSRIEGSLKRKDAIVVTITPFDGKIWGRPLTLRREIRNVPPSIEGVKDARLDGKLYSCTILATDGDGDSLTYVLKEAPPGMSIEAPTGTIRWEIPPAVMEKVPVTVAVSDGNGGEASYSMTVTIGEEGPPQKPSSQDRVSGETEDASPPNRQR